MFALSGCLLHEPGKMHTCGACDAYQAASAGAC